MTNVEMAAIFRRIGDLLEIKGDNPYKIQAYRRAAETLEALDAPAARLLAEGVKVPGFGEAITAKIEEMERTGRLRFYEELAATIPASLIELMRVPNLGPKKVKLLYEQLGVTNLDELEAAARERQIATVKGLGAKTEAAILAGIEDLRNRSDRAPLGAALQLAQTLRERLGARPEVRQVEIAGSIRRMCDTVGDVDVVVTSEAPLRTIDVFCGLPFVAEVLDRGAAEASVLSNERLRADLLVVDPDRFGAALLYLTGSRAHNDWLKRRARERGMRLTERGLFGENRGPWTVDREASAGGATRSTVHGPRSTTPVAGATEAEIYAALDLPDIPPEIREPAVFPLAERGELPALVSVADIRGDLHSHTEWSDGSLTIEQLAEAARAHGYRYLAITDHSRGLGFVGGLNEERVLEQARQIRQLNARWDPAEFQLLAGTEMEIRTDGSLDFPDEVLAQLDFVIASIHSGFRQSRERVTERLVRALRNPYVNLIGHPTGRIIGRRPGYDFDRETVFRVAAETGTALEINAHWARLDLKDEDAALARALGCTLAINTDAHSPAEFGVLRYGVGTARRAWIGPNDVLNTRDLAGIRAFVQAKRDRLAAG